MANIHKILNVEIRRLAKKEAKAALEPLKSRILQLREQVKAQNRQIQALMAATPNVKEVPAPVSEKPEKEEKTEKKYRLPSQRIEKIRSKIGVSQTLFAKMLGASLKSVVNWESGSVKPREYMKPKIIELSKLGKHELAARIAEAKSSAAVVAEDKPVVDEDKEN